MGVWYVVGMLVPPSLRLRADNLLMTYSFVCWSGFLLDKQEWDSQAPIWGLFPPPRLQGPGFFCLVYYSGFLGQPR